MDISKRELELLALVAFEELPGREIAKRYKDETGSIISYGTLYTTFRRLKDEGFVLVREDEDADGRLRYFKITGEGSRALQRARRDLQKLAGFGLGWAT
jgi:DNA-binding PadR family transcriptional regulator